MNNKLIYNDFEQRCTWYGYIIGIYINIKFILIHHSVDKTFYRFIIDFAIFDKMYEWNLFFSTSKIRVGRIEVNGFTLLPAAIIQPPRTIKFFWLSFVKVFEKY